MHYVLCYYVSQALRKTVDVCTSRGITALTSSLGHQSEETMKTKKDIVEKAVLSSPKAPEGSHFYPFSYNPRFSGKLPQMKGNFEGPIFHFHDYGRKGKSATVFSFPEINSEHLWKEVIGRL